jgi:hypothetical protein
MNTFSFYFSACVISLILVSGCRSMKSEKQDADSQTAIWQKQPLVIDGSDSDWVKPLAYYDRKEKISYGVSNDKDNIYLMLSTRDPMEQQKILQGGMTVWINKQAQKDETAGVGIGFPTDSRNNHDRDIMAAAQPDRYKDKKITLDDLKDYSLYGFKQGDTVENYEYGQKNDENVEVEMNYNAAGDLIYEAIVPLRAVFPKNSATAYIGKMVGVGIFVEGLPPTPGSRRAGGGSPVSVGGGLGFGLGMGGFGGGGMGISIGSGAFGRGGGRNGDKQMYEQGKIWQVVSLARPH